MQTEQPEQGPTRAKRGRKPKYSPEELERRTLLVAVESVIAQGVTAGVDAIRLEKVIIEADAPRGAAYELWDAKGSGTSQQNLRRAAVVEILRTFPAGNVDSTRDYALARIAAHADRLATGDPDDRSWVMSELIRDVTAFNFELLQDQRWRVYKTLVSSVGTQEDEELWAAAVEGEDQLVEAYAGLLGELAALFELQLRDCYAPQHFSRSVYALNEGLSNRVGTTFQDQKLIRDGAEWTTFAVGFEALVNQYFEYRPSA